VLALAVVLILLPVKVTCGTAAPGWTCLPAPDPSGYSDVYYEIEPLGIALIERVKGTNVPLFYHSGHDRRR
jgi:hypothetical protein